MIIDLSYQDLAMKILSKICLILFLTREILSTKKHRGQKQNDSCRKSVSGTQAEGEIILRI